MESLKNFLGFYPCKGEKSHVDLVRKIKEKVISQTHHGSTSLTNRIHHGLVALVFKGMITKMESATINPVWALSR